MFDLLVWDARQNARHRRMLMVRRGEVVNSAFFLAEAQRKGLGDHVRAVVNDHCGFDFCGVVSRGMK